MIWTRTLVAGVTLVTTGVLVAYQEKGSKSTSDGQKLFQQCSGCHSAETGESKVGPSLKGLFQKRKLHNGDPANERSIRTRIKNGGDGMPAYDQILSAEELDRLIAYLKRVDGGRMMNCETGAQVSKGREHSGIDGHGRKYGSNASALESYGMNTSIITREGRLLLFEEVILPHLNAAYNLARWLTRNEQDAQDVVQEAYLRAFRFFDSYRGGDGKAWLLEVVRNTCFTLHRRERRNATSIVFDEAAHTPTVNPPNPEEALVNASKQTILQQCIENLPQEFREIIVMRELEEMSYRQIADVAGLPPGTVMSRLSRARKRLEECAKARNNGARR